MSCFGPKKRPESRPRWIDAGACTARSRPFQVRSAWRHDRPFAVSQALRRQAFRLLLWHSWRSIRVPPTRPVPLADLQRMPWRSEARDAFGWGSLHSAPHCDVPKKRPPTDAASYLFRRRRSSAAMSSNMPMRDPSKTIPNVSVMRAYLAKARHGQTIQPGTRFLRTLTRNRGPPERTGDPHR